MRKQKKKNSNFQTFTILLHQHTTLVFPFRSLLAANEKNEQTSEFILNPQLISEREKGGGGRGVSKIKKRKEKYLLCAQYKIATRRRGIMVKLFIFKKIFLLES